MFSDPRFMSSEDVSEIESKIKKGRTALLLEEDVSLNLLAIAFKKEIARLIEHARASHEMEADLKSRLKQFEESESIFTKVIRKMKEGIEEKNVRRTVR